jgi:hypothetical protein
LPRENLIAYPVIRKVHYGTSIERDPKLLRQIKPSSLLSFGPDTPGLDLESLNIFIGPNGTGKSNLIEALALMRATPVPPQTTSNADILVLQR